METYPNLNRLLQRDEGTSTKGRRQQASVRERSEPTGWETRHGVCSVQELAFSNGYVVMALNLPKQKAVIKGPEAALGLLEAIRSGDAEACISEWLDHVSKKSEGLPSGSHIKEHQYDVHHDSEPESTGSTSDAERDEIDLLKADVADIKSAMADIVGFIKQQTPKPNQS